MSGHDSQTDMPLLDADQIEMLAESGSEDSLDLFAEILELFEQESQIKIEELRQLRDAGSYDSMGRAAHALAGSSANIGGLQVWRKAKDIENLCKNASGPEAAAELDKLEALYEETLEALRQFAQTGKL